MHSDQIIKFEYNLSKVKKQASSTVARKKISFSEKSERAQRNDANRLASSTGDETNLLIRAASTSARKRNKKDLAAVLKETIKSPERASKMRRMCHDNETKPIKMSPDEGLAFLLDNNFTKEQYINIRTESKSRNCDIYPSYDEILKAKLKCRPENIEVTNTMANVPLQSLLSHTAERIVEMQLEVIKQTICEDKALKAHLIVSYGFDSSTGQSQFKQNFTEPGKSLQTDSSLLATTLIPLRLIYKRNQRSYIGRG